MKPFLFSLIAVSVFGQKTAVQTWVPTFVDEFDDRDLDLAKWSPHDPLRSVYASGSETVSSGRLHLSKGAVVSTYGLFSQAYGKFEIRCKGVAGGLRLLPAPLSPLPSSLPSLDVFELESAATSKFQFGNHWGTEQTERSFGDTLEGPDLSRDFHVIAIEWETQEIRWFIDGKERFRSREGIPAQRMFLRIDLQGDIDYVRVYKAGLQ